MGIGESASVGTPDPLLGRDAEFATLTGLVDRLTDRSPGFLFIQGEPGIGKTRLLAELARLADDREMLVLGGTAAEFEAEVAFAVIVDAIDAYLESMPPITFERLPAETGADLGLIFPSLRSLAADQDGPAIAQERVRAYYAVRELLERLAATRPLLLILDDLHWADRASLELVCHLLRRPPEAPVLIVGAFRTGQADPLLATTIDRTAAEGGLVRIELGPLGRADADELVGDSASRDHSRLYEASGGNPFYLLQLARSGAAGDAIELGEAGGGGIPAAVFAAIEQELDGLSPQAQALARGGAVVGDPFEIDLAAEAAGIGEEEALELLDDLTARELVHQADIPRRFRFRHPLVRAAVYQSTPPGVRLAAHERTAAALAQRGAPAQERAHHVEHAAKAGDEASAATLSEAADWARMRAPASAARWYEASLRLRGEAAPRAERLELLIALAMSLGETGELARARAALVEAIDLVPPEASVLRVQLIAGCARVEGLLGRHADARRRLERELESGSEQPAVETIWLLVALSLDAFYAGDFAAMDESSRRALEVARTQPDETLIAMAVAGSAMAAAFAGEVERADALREEGASLIDGRSDEELFGLLESVSNLCGAELFLDHYEDAVVHAERGLGLARATGAGASAPTLTITLGTALWALGRLPESTAVLLAGVDAARVIGNSQALVWLLSNQAMALLHAGDLRAARRAARESVEIAEGEETNVVAAWAWAILAAVLAADGDAAEARRALVDRVGGHGLDSLGGGWRVYYLECLVAVELELGEATAANDAAEVATQLAQASGLPMSATMAARADARIALAAGDHERAVERARSSATSAEQCGSRLEAARSRALAGAALSRAGREDEAIAELAAAAAELDACGAPRYRDEAERELRRAGGRVHRRSKPGGGEGGLESLTGREREVAALVAEHHSNKEIAAELFLSLKTIETHLRNIFRKLDVSSRAEVARAVSRSAAARPPSG